MANLEEMRRRCQVVLIDGLSGRQFQVERLERRPGDYFRGYRLTQTGAAGAPAFAHELQSGAQECSCPAWAEKRECEHTALLVGAGLFSEPGAWFGPVNARAYDPFADDELVEIEWESEAP